LISDSYPFEKQAHDAGNYAPVPHGDLESASARLMVQLAQAEDTDSSWVQRSMCEGHIMVKLDWENVMG
jgi:hypothetical protein